LQIQLLTRTEDHMVYHLPYQLLTNSELELQLDPHT